MIFSNDEIVFIVGIIKNGDDQDDFIAICRSIGTLDRLIHGGIHIRDLEAIPKALVISANQNIDAEHCLPLIAKVSRLIKDAPPFPQPITGH